MSLKFTVVATRSLCVLGLCAFLVGCGTESEPITSKSTNYEVGGDTPGDATSAAAPATGQSASTSIATEQTTPKRPTPMNQPPAAVASSPDVVQPTVEQILNVMRRLQQQQPKQGSEDEVIADFVNIQTQVIQAAEMLIEMKPGDDEIQEAAQAKIEALTAVSQLGADGAIEQLFAFTEELEKHPSEQIQAFARQQSFITLLNAFSTDQVSDAQKVIDAYKQLAAQQPKEGGLLQFGRDVSSRFIEKGMNKQAADLLLYTASLVQPTEDPRLNAAANSLIEQAKFAEVDLGARLNAVADKEDGAIEKFTEMLNALTAGETVGATTLQTLMQIASMLEGQHGDAAAKVYDVLEVSIGKTSEAELGEVIKESIDKYRLRSSIVGKPFALEGNLIDGTPFDWSQYKGKVVLVDFWATWCGPCLQEMPNIRANYEKYREQGFEVVGVNLDEEAQELKDFNALQPLPWPSVLSADPAAVGWDHPMVIKNGVAAIPFLVLVDREGTAIALNTRGSALGEKLAELFPEPTAPAGEVPAATESAKPAATATEPAPAETEKAPDTDPAPTPKKAESAPE